MKHFTITLLILLLLGFTNYANASTPEKVYLQNEQQIISRYKLYPTENMWTFIKLDTRNGKMWQVQFSVKGNDYRYETVLNATALSLDSTNGRFELYPTQNMYNFMLLDRIDGKTWQVQWSQEPENRGVLPIQ